MTHRTRCLQQPPASLMHIFLISVFIFMQRPLFPSLKNIILQVPNVDAAVLNVGANVFFKLPIMDLLYLISNEQHFDLDKSRQKIHHGLKEHHKISNIPKFRCKML